MEENNNNAYEPNFNSDNEQNQDASSVHFNNNNQASSDNTKSTDSPYFQQSCEYSFISNLKKEKSSKLPIILILGIVVIATLLVVCLSILSSYMSRLERASQYDSRVNVEDEELLIIQNSPKIEVSKNTDVDYVPQSIPEVVNKIGDSVVEIKTSSVSTDRFYHQYVTSGAGSGVIITQSNEAGYLLTNHHVIDGATEVTVRLTNTEEYKAQVLGSDAELDLAVLRITKKSAEAFTVAPIGDSSKLAVGQQVIAIGNPLGSLGGTVTDGIISALDRNVTIDNVSMVLLQHNAAINPGNSGGGLFDAMGNLIGVVNAKTSETGIEGLGFAIPVNIAYKFFNRVMVVEPSIGIKVTYGSINRVVGVYVTDIADLDSKFKLYDQIVAVNGIKVEIASDYYYAIEELSSGDTVTFTVKRNNSTVDIKITLK